MRVSCEVLLMPIYMQLHKKLERTCELKMPELARLAGMVPPSAPLKLMLRYTGLPNALLGRTSAPLPHKGWWLILSVVLCNNF